MTDEWRLQEDGWVPVPVKMTKDKKKCVPEI